MHSYPPLRRTPRRRSRVSGIARLLACVLLTALFVQAAPAQAHGYLLRAIPEDRAVLERPPTRLQYWFSEDLEPGFSTLHLRDQDGTILASGGVSETNSAALMLRVPPGLPDGAYIVELRPAFASDGHAVVESRVFFVGVAPGGIEGQAADPRALPLEVLWRTITLAGTLLLFGVFVLYAGVLLPAWGTERYPAGGLPPRVMRRLAWIIGLGWAAAFAGNGLALLQQTMVFFNVDFGRALSPSLWSVVRIGSRFGDVWNARVVFLLLVGGMFAASLYFWDSNPRTVRSFWTANAWVMALVIGTFSVTSHAAGSQVLPWVGVLVDWLHATAVGVWVGGLAALVLVLPTALHPYTQDQRRLALLAVLRRFSRTASAALVIVISTGLYSSATWIATPGEATQTAFGGALLVKLLLVGGLIGLGAVHHAALRPERFAWLAARVRWDWVISLRLEALVALLVLAAVGQLSATPVPVPAFSLQETATPAIRQAVGTLEAQVSITPGGPGVNTYDVQLTQGALPLDDAQVMVRFSQPAADSRSASLPADRVDAGLFVASGAEIDAPGLWWLTVDVLHAGTVQRLAAPVEIATAAAVTQSRPPQVRHLAALAGVIAALGWVFYPALKRFYTWLEITPATASLILGTTAATALVSVGGLVVLQQTQARARAELNPPPQVINSVLPDHISLQRGQTLYNDTCRGWPAARDLDALRISLPRLRDEDLFYATADGWRSVPACAPGLTADQRWDIVNYIRTWEITFPQETDPVR